MRKAIFLDRDGTINVEKNYLYKMEEWEWLPGSIEAIKGFKELGYTIIVVTNQSGIARGYYSHEDVNSLHKYVNNLLEAQGTSIDAFYFCPHHDNYGDIRNCKCRKPKTGLFEKAKKDFDIDLDSSFMIGDKMSDAKAGKQVGLKTFLVSTGYGKTEMLTRDDDVTIVDNLYHAYILIKQSLNNG